MTNNILFGVFLLKKKVFSVNLKKGVSHSKLTKEIIPT